MRKLILKISLAALYSIMLSHPFARCESPIGFLRIEPITLNADSPAKSAPKPSTDSVVSTKPPSTKVDTTGLSSYSSKVFIFNQGVSVTECNAAGDTGQYKISHISIKGARFTVVSVKANGDLVILFWIWDLKSGDQENSKMLEVASIQNEDYYKRQEIIIKRKTFNFIKDAELSYAPASIDTVNDNRRFFILTKSNFNNFCSVYTSVPSWNITFGALTTPFKLRLFNRFSFNNNTSVGGAVYFQKKFLDKDFSWGLVLGLSLSSVTLDASSTNVYPDSNVTVANKSQFHTSPLTTSTTRPAFTPSLSYMISYKNINFLIGGGFDFIAKTTNIPTAINPEAGWIYNGKPWLGIGFGISLFNNSSSSSTPPAEGQNSSQ